MILDGTDQTPGVRFLFILACVVVIVFGLRYAAPILLPSALALYWATSNTFSAVQNVLLHSVVRRGIRSGAIRI